jgi:CubicO group peptidase (beta-lactamase class C family)
VFAVRSDAQERQAWAWPTNAWGVSTPEAQGKIVADACYAPYGAGIRHDLRSVTKSFLSTLIGVLVQQGKLASVERPVLDFFPDRTIANLDDRKRAITVQSLLNIRHRG